MAFSRRLPQARSPKRLTAWDSGPQRSLGSLSATGKAGFTTGVVLAQDSKATIVRIRGSILFQLTLATAAGDGMSGAVGLGIVSSDAFAVGTTAIPGPFSDPEWPGWMWHSFWHLNGVAAQSLGADVSRNSNADLRLEIDTKAMRKWSVGETLMGMFEIAVETGTAAVAVTADTRVLVKLS